MDVSRDLDDAPQACATFSGVVSSTGAQEVETENAECALVMCADQDLVHAAYVTDPDPMRTRPA